MRNYDLTLIFSPLLAEQEANDRFQTLVSFVQGQGGIMEDQRMVGKKPLLAPIKSAKEGYVGVVSFSLNEEKLPELEKECKEQNQILRFLLARQPKAKKTETRTPAPAAASTSSSQTPSVEQKKEEKIDLEDIDQKLEEMFNEEPKKDELQ